MRGAQDEGARVGHGCGELLVAVKETFQRFGGHATPQSGPADVNPTEPVRSLEGLRPRCGGRLLVLTQWGLQVPFCKGELGRAPGCADVRRGAPGAACTGGLTCFRPTVRGMTSAAHLPVSTRLAHMDRLANEWNAAG
nr:hypothetical protein StreXyl84_43520 [Streptomyces sp. Xyl84]